MSASGQLVVFSMEGQRFAVPLPAVVRVLPAVETTPVPGAPPTVMGVFDLHGEVIPVIDRRQRPAAALRISDHFVVVRTERRVVALPVDDVIGVVEHHAADSPPPGTAVAGLEDFVGATRLDQDLVLIHDIEKFLSPQDAQALDRAMEAMA